MTKWWWKISFVVLLVFLLNGLIIEDSRAAPSEEAGLKGLTGRVEKIGAAGNLGTKPLEAVIGGYIKTALVLVGTIFLMLTVYGGYIWFMARDNEEEAKRAKDIIQMAAIGLIVILGAYAITYFIVFRLTQAAGVNA